jgi:hypothetical protein
MSWIRSRHGRTAQRLAAIDDYRFPAGVRHRFTLGHGDLDTGAVALVQSASRQWFRLAARHRAAHLSMPSVVVDELWREMVRDTRDYAEFCDAAFGRPLLRPPEPGPDRPARLATTFRLARADENGPPEALPLLFRVDRELGVPGGGRYLADCGGGRGVCHELPGATCLRHIAGVKPARRWPGSRENTSRPPGADAGGDPGAGGFGL